MHQVDGQDLRSADLIRGYRPWLDGLRGVAVLMVVLQHATNTTRVDLSSVGVGAFFALSGYLITSLLLDEHAATGRFSLRSFYKRRAARLVPALVLVVGVCNLLFLFQRDFAPVRGSAAAVTYTANYATILDSDFVAGYGPTWTLAVEEHFYILWPLTLLLLMRRLSLQNVLRVTLALCGVTLVWRATLAYSGAPHVALAIGSFERADALLYGCAAAIAVSLGWRPKRWLFWASFITLLVSIAALKEDYGGLIVGNAVLALAAAGAVVSLEYAAPRIVQRAFSARTLVSIGVVSYGLYLWHGPLMRVARNGGLDGVGWRALVGAASIAVAWASFRYVEAPIRARVRRATRPPSSIADREPVPTAPAVLAVEGSRSTRAIVKRR